MCSPAKLQKVSQFLAWLNLPCDYLDNYELRRNNLYKYFRYDAKRLQEICDYIATRYIIRHNKCYSGFC